MPETLYPPTSAYTHRRRVALAPEIHKAFESFSKAVFTEGALDEKTKQLIAVAVAHTTQCPYCIVGHTKLAHRTGATDEQIMEAIWVAAEMRAGGAYAHAALAINALGVPKGDAAGDAAGTESAAGHGHHPGPELSDQERRAISRQIWEGGPVYS